ncbi:MAG: [FeFe] hydrogenase, group A [Candidatus Magasanikbacteria bacterium]|nr:[FeFe] hydrogenase, group A [Candidatus Magasanikbacteria bacterium]
MPKKFQIKIDGKNIDAMEGETILQAALRSNIDIPHLCQHPDLSVRANCRMCMVSVKGIRSLVTACSTNVAPGMEIISKSPAIKRSRKFNLEMIFGEHVEDCPVCVWNSRCDLLKYRKELNSKMLRFEDRKVRRPIYEFGPIVFDQTKCIDCRNCVEVCPVEYLEVSGKGSEIGIEPSANRKKDCIACGQCIVHCPAGAIKSVGEYSAIDKLEKLFKQKDKIVVVQFAPSIRVSIGEELGLPYGAAATNQLSAGLRALGFNYVFDTSAAADFTTIEEASEAVERIKKGENLPIFTSCCPSWVMFMEFNRPDYVKHLSTARSPEIMLGGLIKTYWAEKEKIDPKQIISVSVMPCTSKKFEIERPEFKINGLKPVDIVITTRELSRWLLNKKIDLKKIKPSMADNPFGDPSGAGVIYGASGGVMESALRTAYWILTGENLKDYNLFKNVRGLDGIKRAVIKLPRPLKTAKGVRTELRVVVTNMIKNARLILDELKKDPSAYDFVEVMTCPGGCIGGGGQSMPVDNSIRERRASSLYVIDGEKKIRLAHENPAVLKAYDDYFKDVNKKHLVFHTKFYPKNRTKIITRRRVKADGALQSDKYKK